MDLNCSICHSADHLSGKQLAAGCQHVNVFTRVAARCGDGIVHEGVEECDDGNDDDTDDDDDGILDSFEN